MIKKKSNPFHLSSFSSGWMTLLLVVFVLTGFARWQFTHSDVQDSLRQLFYGASLQSATSENSFDFVDLGKLSSSTALTQITEHWKNAELPEYFVWLPNDLEISQLKQSLLMLQQNKQVKSKNPLDTGVIPKLILSREQHLRTTAKPSPFIDIPPWSVYAFQSVYKNFVTPTQSESFPLQFVTANSSTQNLPLLFKFQHGWAPSLQLWLTALSMKEQMNLQLEHNQSISPLDFKVQYDGAVWLANTFKSHSPLTLETFLAKPRPNAIVIFGRDRNAELSTLQKQLLSLNKNNVTVEFAYYDLVLVFALLLGVLLFQISLKWQMSHTAFLWFALFTATIICQWFVLRQVQTWLPWLELSLIISFACLFGVLERRHQKPLLQLLKVSEEWGQQAALYLQENNKLEDAFYILKQLPKQRENFLRAYQLGQLCEKKRNYAVAESIYLWIIRFDKSFKDCQSRLEKLRQLKQNQFGLSNTLMMDKTMILNGEGLQPPTLGRYQIEGVLGNGAMSVVYQGIDPAINRKVAIKTLALNREFDGQDQSLARERFFREAETAGQLSHPNIVTIYDVGEDNDLAFIAMDQLSGEGLDKFTKKGKLLPVVDVYQIMYQITSALAYAHKRKVVHRDIKPANLMYDQDQHKVIVTDFGIACLTDHSKTRTGAILGSPFYMSPEQIQGERVDGRSDIFSLGITFYQLLCGQLPFQGESIATVALNISTKKHEPVRKIRPDLPASSSRIVNKALLKDKNERFQTVEEFKDAIANALKRDFNMNPN